LASIATTMHCAPYLADASTITCGSATAAELKLTLSAPALSSRRTSATRAHAAADGERDEHLRRHRLDDVQDQSRPSLVAVMSRKVSSSAPCSL
jgi:hypothetical protein